MEIYQINVYHVIICYLEYYQWINAFVNKDILKCKESVINVIILVYLAIPGDHQIALIAII